MSVGTCVPVKDPLLLNVPTAARELGITVWQLRGLIWAKKIPVVQIGRKLYLRRATLTRWTENEEGKHRV